MSSQNDLSYYVDYPSEERFIEYKKNAPWRGDSKHKIARTIMAMSNLRDGGWIIIGKEQKDDGSFDKVGVTNGTYESYNLDNIKDYLFSHVEPMIKIELQKEEIDGLMYVGLKIEGLNDVPHICKTTEGPHLERGVIYVRSPGKEGCIRLTDYKENKEIVDICSEVGFKQFVDKLKISGLIEFRELVSTSDEEKFDEEISDIY